MQHTSDKIKLGVVGVGQMGSHHARISSNLRHGELVGVYDPNQKAARDVAATYGIIAFPTLEDLCQSVDAVIIATPTTAHHSAAMTCIKAGKHLLIEKPIAATLEEGEEICAAAHNKGVILQAGHIERFNPVYRELEHILQNEEVVAFSAQRLSPHTEQAKDISVVLDLMLHDLDILLALTDGLKGAPQPMVVQAFGRAIDVPKPNYVQAQVLFETGLIASLTASKITQDKIRTVEVHCKDCFIKADFLHREIEIFRKVMSNYYIKQSNTVGYKQSGLIEQVHVPRNEPLAVELEHFVESVRLRKDPIVSGYDGLRVLQLAMKVEHEINRNYGRTDGRIADGADALLSKHPGREGRSGTLLG